MSILCTYTSTEEKQGKNHPVSCKHLHLSLSLQAHFTVNEEKQAFGGRNSSHSKQGINNKLHICTLIDLVSLWCGHLMLSETISQPTVHLFIIQILLGFDQQLEKSNWIFSVVVRNQCKANDSVHWPMKQFVCRLNFWAWR